MNMTVQYRCEQRNELLPVKYLLYKITNKKGQDKRFLVIGQLKERIQLKNT